MELDETLEYKGFRKQFLKHLDQLSSEQHKIIVSYFGEIYPDFIHNLIETLEHYLIERKIELERVKNIYSISLQSLNNMLIYGQKDELDQKLVSFFVSMKDEQFFISCSNLVSNESKEFLVNYLSRINEMDRNDIQTLYMKAVEKSFSSRENNGIGIISMRNHSKSHLKFNFYPINKSWIFFLEMC